MKRSASQRASQKPTPSELNYLCGQPGPDDGVDPRVFFKPNRDRRSSRKDWQLCRQVSATLNYVLSGESHDEILHGLIVDGVEPAPDAHRLLVTVCPFAPEKGFNPIVVLERLKLSVGRLRAEVSRSISRRKVPELVFRVTIQDSPVPSEEGVVEPPKPTKRSVA